jgi:hypothetical protein
MIVADQKTTDAYGVWGQWWGYPYFPSKYNLLEPGDQGEVVIQWALRDPIRAYEGEGWKVSNYSMQANDYSKQGLGTDYFVSLAETYLKTTNKLGQITVGLETGQESMGYLQEMGNQLKWIEDQKDIKVVSMSDFGDSYKSSYKNNPEKIMIGGWNLTPTGRQNDGLGERRTYNNYVFSDYWTADKSSFLNRVLPIEKMPQKRYWPVWIAVMVVGLLTAKKWLEWKETAFLGIWVILTGGYWLRAGGELGKEVFYGPIMGNLMVEQVIWAGGLLIVGVLLIKKKISWMAMMMPMVMTVLVTYLRTTIIDGGRYVGVLDKIRFVALGWNNGIKLINEKLWGNAAAALQGIDLEWWWKWYPLIAIGLIVAMGVGRKLMPKKVWWVMGTVTIVLVMVYIKDWLTADPMLVK